MLDIQFIRDNKEKVITAAKNKNREVDIKGILTFDDKKRELMTEVQKLREERNNNAKTKPTQDIIEKGKKLKDQIQKIEAELSKIDEELNNSLSQVPNIPLSDAPVGSDSSKNVELYKKGIIPKFDFKPKSHIELCEDLNLAELERGSKVSGFRGYFLKNQLAQLHCAVLFYVFQKLISRGYIPLIAPSIVKGFTLFGSGQFPWGEQEVYTLNDSDAYLAGTAEVGVTALHSGDILLEKEMPKKYVAMSPCFRREAGSYGKDSKGLYRLHEFWKIEQVIIAKDDLSHAKELHTELQKNTEDILNDLELPYRVLNMCTGDMGEPQICKYDTEVWMPSRDGYGEVGSNSIMGTFQARRLNLRYKEKDGTTHYCYTLNNTAIASPRILIPLLEIHQQKDGSVNIPKALQTLTGFINIYDTSH